MGKSSSIHSLSYSIIGYQSAYLATHWNPIYWDTACLIVDSDSIDSFTVFDEETEIKDNSEEDEEKKNKAINYGKLAIALNKVKSAGIVVTPPDINLADKGFSPDPDRNRIIYALKGLRGVGEAEITQIIENRPYTNFEDFVSKVNIKKTAIIALIKAGAFDELENAPREEIMNKFITEISEPKKVLNMRNFKGLLDNKLLPESLDLQRRTFNFFKYLKQKEFKVDEDKYFLDERAIDFLSNNYPSYEDYTTIENNQIVIDTKIWKRKVYDKSMLVAKQYIIDNQEELLKKINDIQFKEVYQKYCKGNISKWEMDSMGIYFHEHELARVDKKRYQLSDFSRLPEEPVIDRIFTIRGRDIPIYSITKIIGTVIAKNNIAKNFTLLTPDGSVVNIKLSDEHFALFNKQISSTINGVKKVQEKSWFSSGNHLMIVGFRRGDSFVPKKYKDSMEQHRIYLIQDIADDGSLTYTSVRWGEEENNF